MAGAFSRRAALALLAALALVHAASAAVVLTVPVGALSGQLLMQHGASGNASAASSKNRTESLGRVVFAAAITNSSTTTYTLSLRGIRSCRASSDVAAAAPIFNCSVLESPCFTAVARSAGLSFGVNPEDGTLTGLSMVPANPALGTLWALQATLMGDVVSKPNHACAAVWPRPSADPTPLNMAIQGTFNQVQMFLTTIAEQLDFR